MSAISLYYPGLLGPDVPLEQLPHSEWPDCDQFIHLCKFLTHGRQQRLPACSIEARMLQGLGVQFDLHRDVPLAHFRARHLPQQPGDTQLWCLDPVFIQIDQEEAVLLGNVQLQLDEYEARHVIDDLNAHLADEQLRVHYVKPHQWLLEGNLQLQTHSLNDVMLQNIEHHQPQGRDERRWRKLINEIQMLLHAHPVNHAREQRGDPGINSVWLWGGAHSSKQHGYEAIIDMVYCDEDYVHDLAMVCDIKHKALPIHIDENILQYDSSLFIFTDQMVAIRHRDVYGWFEHLRRLDRQVLAPLMTFLEQGKLASLTIYSDTVSITLTKKMLGQWWKRRRPFSKGMLKLRTNYA